MKTLAASLMFLFFTTALTGADEVVRRGTGISKEAKLVPLADILEEPDSWTSAPVVVEGVVKKVCETKGCWMEIAPESGKRGIRVTFLDYGFFVPENSQGMNARMEGRVEVKRLSKAHADHLEEEGASVERQPDGGVIETSFVATGVELRKPATSH